MDKKTSKMILAFLTGVVVGANWPKIKKYIGPFLEKTKEKTGDGYNHAVKFFAEKKEEIDDLIAASKIKRAKAKGGKTR